MAYPAHRKSPPPRTFCRNGHELAVAGTVKVHGNRHCKICLHANRSRARIRRRKCEQIEPEYEVLDETQVPLADVRVPRGYWDSIMRSLDLLENGQWMRIELPPGYHHHGGSIHYAAKRAGLVVVHFWTSQGLFMKRVRRSNKS